MEETQIYGALTAYRERGAYLRRLEQIEKSKAAYDEAFKSCPVDVRTLTGRSQVATDAVQPAEAMFNAELALKLEPNKMIALNVQARALQTMSEFEKSVVMNYRGYRRRRQPPYFMEGIIQGLEIIQDCIGVNSGNVMEDFLPIIMQNEKNIDNDEPPKVFHESRIPQPHHKRKLTQMEAKKHLTLARVLAMKYLGPMAYDNFFLHELKKDPRLNSANAGGSAELKQIVNHAFNSLRDRQDMLRTQRPYYTIKLSEKAESKHRNKYRERALIQEQETGTRTAEKLLKQIEKCVTEHRVMDVLTQAERMQRFLDIKTPRTLPDKDLYIDRLYNAVGNAYLNQHRLSYTLSERGNRRRIAFLMGLPVGRSKSFDSVMANYPHKFIDVREATAKVKSTLDMCENATMKCWLIYELSRLLCTQKNYIHSKFYAKMCQREAQEINSVVWWLNGCFALMSADMKQGNVNDIKALVEEAYEYSKRMSDPEKVQAFLAKCLEMAEEPRTSDAQKAILQRQAQILGVMDEAQRVPALVLFKRISTLPPGRRISVLPTKKEYNHAMRHIAERKHHQQKRLSVVPGPDLVLPEPPKSATRGFQIFDI